jgi:hypothetical protein
MRAQAHDADHVKIKGRRNSRGARLSALYFPPPHVNWWRLLNYER